MSRLHKWISTFLVLTCAVAGAEDDKSSATNLEFVRLLGDPAFKHAGDITHVSPHSKGRMLTSSYDGSARIWNIESGKELQRFTHRSLVPGDSGGSMLWNSVVLGPDHIATTGGGKVRIWNSESGKMIREFAAEENSYVVAPVPGGPFFVSGHENSVVRVRNWMTGENVGEFIYADGKKAVWTMVSPAAGKVIVAGNGPVQLWDFRGTKLLKTFSLEGDPQITKLRISPDGTRVLFLPNGRELHCLDSASLETIWAKDLGRMAAVNAWSPDGKHILCCGSGKLAQVASETGVVDWRKPLPFNKPVDSVVGVLAYSEDGSEIYCGGNRMIYRFTASGEQLFPDPANPYLCGEILSAEFSSDGDNVFAVGGNHRIHRFELDSGKELSAWDPSLEITHFSTTPERDQLIAANREGTVKSLSAETGEILEDYNVGKFTRFSVGASGLMIVQIREGRIHRWRGVENLGSLNTGAYEQQSYAPIGVSRGGKFIATTAKRSLGGLRIWETKSGALWRPIASDIPSLLLHLFPDAGVLVSADREGKLHAWFRPEGDQIPKANPKISRHVEALRSDLFSDRQSAKTALLALGDEAIYPLEALQTKDPEMELQIAGILGELRPAMTCPTTEVLQFAGPVTGFDSHPDGIHWVAITSNGVQTSTIHFGTCDRANGKFEIVGKVGDPHGARLVRFSNDGKWLLTLNRTGTVGVFRFTTADGL